MSARFCARRADSVSRAADYDNFTYPRYCLDVYLFSRLREWSAVKSQNYLKWSAQGPRREFVLAIGNPGIYYNATYAQPNSNINAMWKSTADAGLDLLAAKLSFDTARPDRRLPAAR